MSRAPDALSAPGSPPRRPPRRRGRTAIVLGLLLLGGAGAAAWAIGAGWFAETDGATEQPIFVARRGPLRISVVESGTIQSRDQVILKNEIEGQATILYLVPEGTLVGAGDLLVELDVSGLQLDRTERLIAVQNAEAAFVKAREDLAVARSQAESDVSLAELEYRFAQEDLHKYVEGEYPRLRMEAEAQITLALEELENASETLRWSERLYEEKYISQTELERDRLAENRARLDHELAVSALELLEQYTHKRRVDELESGVAQTRMALDRVRRTASATVVQAEAELRAKESELARRRDRLALLDDQIAKARIVAPRAGMAVYATSGRSNWRGNDEPLKEGQSVRERQELIFLPTTNSMMADVRIHESSLEKVAIGQQVVVTVDALPDRVFTGRVARISPLPDGTSVWLNPDLKLFPTEIHLDGQIDDVRTGMTCRAEIIVERLQDVVYVPVQAVVRVGEQPSLYIRGLHGFEPRAVEVGLDNNHMIHVRSGLAAGEVVLLAPPLSEGRTRDVEFPVQQEADPGLVEQGPGTGDGGRGDGERGAGRRGPGGRSGGGDARTGPEARIAPATNGDAPAPAEAPVEER